MMSASPFGLLNIHKPTGVSSRKVLDRIVPLVRPAKVGHAGTLDPLASGVLVVCLGKATRLVGYVQSCRKIYQARFLLGRRSDTDDITGEVSLTGVAHQPARDELETALRGFLGRIEQVPPSFSAVHLNGRRAYRLARQGRDVCLSPRPVEVHRIDLQRYAYPEVDVDIECGAGTYIRSIGRDVGEKLGCGAVMSRLVRTAVGPFTLAEAISTEQLTTDSLRRHLLPASMAVAHLPAYHCTTDDLVQLRHGRRITASLAEDAHRALEPVAVMAPDGELAAVAQRVEEGRFLAPQQVFLA